MAIDIFANNASATVSAGGTTAPAAGTVENWTLANVVNLAASNGATQMRVIDPAAPSEIILLTDLATGSVIRGAEGTVPVAHASGFTIQGAVTAGALFANTPGDLNVVWPNVQDGANMRWSSGNAAVGIASEITVSPYTLLRPCTIDSISLEVTTAGAAGALGYFGFYAANGDGRPGKLLQQSGSVDCTTTGSKALTLVTPLVIDRPQLIYAAVGFNDATIGCRGFRSTAGVGVTFGLVGRGNKGDNTPRAYGYGYSWAVNGVFDQSPSWNVSSNRLLPNTGITFSDAK